MAQRSKQLRVFACVYKVGTDPGKGSNYWLTPISNALTQHLDCDVVIPTSVEWGYGYGRSLDRQWLTDNRPRYTEQLLQEFYQAHRQRPVDLFFSYFTSAQIDPAAIDEIKRLGIPCVNFFCDNLNDFRLVEEIAGKFTLNWVAEKRACEIYRVRGLPHVYLPMAACPSYHAPRPVAAEDLDVSFCGSFQPPRVQLVGAALDRGLRIHCFGPQTDRFAKEANGTSRTSWPRAVRTGYRLLRKHVATAAKRGLARELHEIRMDAACHRYRSYPPELLHPALDDEDVIRLYARSKVSLGVNRMWLTAGSSSRKSGWYSYPRLRDFEATMSGACYLTEYAEEHDELFEIGEEIEVYRDSDELVDKAQWLLRDHDRRLALRTKARQAAVARHAWKHRFEKLFDVLGL